MGYGSRWSRYDDYGGWPEYVSVAQRRANAASESKRLEKERGRPLTPIKLDGRKIASTFWGKAWCDNLESYSDFSNRLPRGRTYVRNGSVIDIEIAKQKITALVSGSSIYEIEIEITALPRPVWREIQRDCSKTISSLMDLLRGRFDQGIMSRLTQKESGLFPKPKEIKMSCSCPDYAGLCKHLAAVMYGVGARLDTAPELLFLLRDVDHLELISQAVAADNLDQALTGSSTDTLAADDLGAMFGIELEQAEPAPSKVRPVAGKPAKKARRPKAAATKAKAGSKPSARAATPAKKKAVVKKGKSAPLPSASASDQTARKPRQAVVTTAARKVAKGAAKKSKTTAKAKPRTSAKSKRA